MEPIDISDATPEPQFRLAGINDITDILAMMDRFYQIDGYYFDSELTQKNLRNFLLDPGLGRLWIVTLGDLKVGYVVLTFGFSFEYKGRDGFIDELFIHEDHRYHGLGKKALDFVINEARQLGLQAIHLEVEEHNQTGKKLYLSRGFRSKGRILLTRDLSQI